MPRFLCISGVLETSNGADPTSNFSKDIFSRDGQAVVPTVIAAVLLSCPLRVVILQGYRHRRHILCSYDNDQDVVDALLRSPSRISKDNCW